jgi:hypothetical protein
LDLEGMGGRRIMIESMTQALDRLKETIDSPETKEQTGIVRVNTECHICACKTSVAVHRGDAARVGRFKSTPKDGSSTGIDSWFAVYCPACAKSKNAYDYLY